MIIYVEEGKFSFTSDCVLQAKFSKSDYQKTSEKSEGSSRATTHCSSSSSPVAENICTKTSCLYKSFHTQILITSSFTCLWISRKNTPFRSTAWVNHMKLGISRLSLGNSSRVTEDQAGGFCTGASPVQAFRQRPHLHSKVTLETQSRGTEARPCPGTAGRQSTSRLHKRAC